MFTVNRNPSAHDLRAFGRAMLIGFGAFAIIAWMSITVPIGIAMSTLLLTIMFILVLPLFSLIVRLADPLRKRLSGSSYWENYPKHPPTLDRLRRPF